MKRFSIQFPRPYSWLPTRHVFEPYHRVLRSITAPQELARAPKRCKEHLTDLSDSWTYAELSSRTGDAERPYGGGRGTRHVLVPQTCLISPVQVLRSTVMPARRISTGSETMQKHVSMMCPIRGLAWNSRTAPERPHEGGRRNIRHELVPQMCLISPVKGINYFAYGAILMHAC